MKNRKTDKPATGTLAVFLACGLLVPTAALAGRPSDSSLPAARSGLSVPAGKTVLMTYVAGDEQARSVAALIKSLRRFGGDYAGSAIKVVRVGRAALPDDVFRGPGIDILPLDLAADVLEYPLAVKAFAAATVEKSAAAGADNLIWMDPGVLVLGPLSALDLEGRYDAAMRPVTLFNDIGLPPGSAPDAYWAPIFRETGLAGRVLPVYRTIVDEVDIQPYFNCEVYAVDPRLGICREWAEIMTVLLKDEKYQHETCRDFRRKLFFHQAVLSAVIASRIGPERLKPLPLAGGYPFSQHAKIPASRRAASLNDLAVVIFDETWARDPGWLDRLPVGEPLKSGLAEIWREYLGR